MADPEQIEDELDIEIVEDTPEDEKPRVKDYVEPDVPEDDEIENYSERVQKRMKKLSFDVKEAERHRKQAAKDREEAVHWAQSVHSENQKLKESLEANRGGVIQQAKGRISAELDRAKSDYKEAYEIGDADKILEAQEKLTSLQNDMYRLKDYKPARPAPQEPAPQPAPQPAPEVTLTPRQQEWLSDNDWYGKDRQMTAFALGVHEDLVQNGVDPNSKKYYTEVDKALQERFSDRLATADGDQIVETAAPTRKANLVAPATRSSKNPQKVRLTQSAVRIAKQLNVPLEEYAAQVLKEQRNNG